MIERGQYGALQVRLDVVQALACAFLYGRETLSGRLGSVLCVSAGSFQPIVIQEPFESLTECTCEETIFSLPFLRRLRS